MPFELRTEGQGRGNSGRPRLMVTRLDARWGPSEPLNSSVYGDNKAGGSDVYGRRREINVTWLLDR